MKNKITKINPHLTIINTRKYKDINLYLRFSVEYSCKIKSRMYVLSKMFAETSKLYKTKTEMSKARDMLYGINVSSSVKGRANVISFNIQYSFINPKFLSDICLDDYADYIKETLFNTLIDSKKLIEAKRTVKDSLTRRLDLPDKYASEKTNMLICEDNKNFDIYGIYKNVIKEVSKVKLDDIKELYDYLLNKACVDVYICGDVDNRMIKKLNLIDLNNRCFVKYKYHKYVCHEKKQIIETKKTNQSILNVIFSTPYNRKHKDFYAFVVGNVLFGSLPTSLLFEEVREKLSLCYSIACIDYKSEGLVKVVTNIDGKNKDLVLQEINKQMKRIIDKNYDNNILQATKVLYSNIIESTYDDQNSLIDFLYEYKLAGIDYSIEEFAKEVMKITADDISRVFKRYKPYIVYMLKGTTNE